MVGNIPIFFSEINLAENIFSADVPKVKEKVVIPHLPVVLGQDIIEIHVVLQNKGIKVDFSIDVFYINEESLFHSVDKSFKLKLLFVLENRKWG